MTYYFIHINSDARPHWTRLSFIAVDFRAWGFQVDCHADSTLYVAEIQRREAAHRRTRQLHLFGLWVRELVMRNPGCEGWKEFDRHTRMARMMGDFWVDLRNRSSVNFPCCRNTDPLHAYFEAIVKLEYKQRARCPEFAPSEVNEVDRVWVWFNTELDRAICSAHIVEAAKRAAVASEGRMLRVWEGRRDGDLYVFVEFYVDAGRVGGLEDERGQLPRYEAGGYEDVEGPPEYEAEGVGGAEG